MITKDMGKNKLNHIESILNEPFITKMSALHEKIMPIPELNMAQLK